MPVLIVIQVLINFKELIIQTNTKLSAIYCFGLKLIEIPPKVVCIASQ